VTEVDYAQGRKSRVLNTERGVRELDHPSLGLRRGGAETIKRKGRKEVVDSERLPVASQMKEDGIGGGRMQVALCREIELILGCGG